MDKTKIENLEKNINSLKEEITNLVKRKESYSKELEDLTDGLVSNFDDPESRAEIRELKSDKDVLQEVIQRKQNELKELEETLSVQQEKYNQQKKYEELISLAKKASNFEDEYNSQLKKLDDILKEEISSLLAVRSDWKETAESFMKKADNIEKGFLQTSNLALSRNGETSNRDELIDRLEEDLNLDSAMSNKVLRSEYYSLTRNMKSPKGITFLGYIHDILQSKTAAKLNK